MMTERHLAIFTWLWLLATLPFLTDAGCSFFTGTLLFLAWVLLGIAWHFRGRRRTAWMWWLTAVAPGCLAVVLTVTDIGLAARVALSRDWLDAHAQRAPLKHEPQWVGLFWVEQTQREGGGLFLYTGSGIISRYGLAYAPTEQGPTRFGDRLLKGRLDGPWHRFVDVGS
jgi:hypothetical protein